MSTQHNKQLEELQALVTQLGAAAASNERRTARLERTTRWSLLGGLGALGIALAITVKPLNDAAAQQETLASTDVQSLVNALNGIKGSLDNLNVVGLMQGAAVRQAKLEANKIVTDAPRVSRQVVSADPYRQPKGKPMLVSCARMYRADDIAMQRLKTRYPLGASVLAYFCQQQHPSLVQKPGIDDATLKEIEDAEYQQAVMAGTVRTMTNAAGLVNNLHAVTTNFGGMMQSVWTRMLEKPKDEMFAIVVENKLPDYCSRLRHSSQPLNPTEAATRRKVANLRVRYPLGAYALGHLCRIYPGITHLDQKTLDEMWTVHRAEYQAILVQAYQDFLAQASVDTIVRGAASFRRFLQEPGAAAYLKDIRYELNLLNRTLSTISQMNTVGYRVHRPLSPGAPLSKPVEHAYMPSRDGSESKPLQNAVLSMPTATATEAK